jgi:hypothetical protein
MTGISVFAALSFYSPLIVMISILLFSIFSSATYKGLFYIFCLFSATALRYVAVDFSDKHFRDPDNKIPTVPQSPDWICNTGVFFPTTDNTYSTFILVLTLTYFLAPMMIISKQNKINTINYAVITFFVSYICYDFLLKKYLYGCVDYSSQLIADGISGIGLGVLVVLILILTGNSSVLFINELTSNKEVCTRPSKQQFKCSLYKNGEIVGASITGK